MLVSRMTKDFIRWWGVPILLAFALMAYFVYAFQREAEVKARIAVEEKQIEFLNRVCKKVGDSYDGNGDVVRQRVIYECPDGQIHIR